MDHGVEWRLVREEAWDGTTNMALDEAAADTASKEGLRTARVFRWKPSTLSMGYNQATDSVDWEFCEREGVDVVRRPTGGGGIYHDSLGDISYSIVVPAADIPGDLLSSYHHLLEPLLDALGRLGIDAGIAETERPSLYQPACYLRDVNPAHDVVVDGRKISGNAQHRTRDAVVQHGSITFERETDRHLGAFADPPVGPDEFEARVTSIREHSEVDRADAVRAVETALAEWSGATEGSWTDEELGAARDLVVEKFSTDRWTRQR